MLFVYKFIRKNDGYDPLLEISPFTILIKLIDFIGGIHHFVTVFGKCIFESDFHFSLPLTQDDLEYCCINDNEKN